MAHGNFCEFNPKESIEDFCERFDFYCGANSIRDNNEENLSWKKAVAGQAMFLKLKILASPTPVSELRLDAIMELLNGHFWPQTIEMI